GPQDPLGHLTMQILDVNYRPSQQTDAKGNKTYLKWSSDGKQLNQVTDTLSNKTQFTYNSGGATDGTLSTSLDAQGHKTQYTYGDSNNPRLPTRVQVIDSDGFTLLRWQAFSYDSKG